MLLEGDCHLIGAHCGGLARVMVDLTHLKRVATATPLIYVVGVEAGPVAGTCASGNFGAVTYNADVCASNGSRPIQVHLLQSLHLVSRGGEDEDARFVNCNSGG